jgi:3-oxoadipate enol-lactonase
MPYISLENNRFFYQQTGSGPDVVLIHPVTSNLSFWVFSGVMDDLASDFRVTVYDLRGHGMTDLTPTGYTSLDMASDLKKLVDALGIQKTFIVGHSFGGVIGVHYALLHPEQVDGVVISDTYFPGLKHLEPDLNQIPIWKKLCDLLKASGVDIGNNIDFQKLFRIVAGLNSFQMGALKKILDPFTIRWLSGLARLAPTTCGNDLFAEAGLGPELLLTYKKPLLALYDEHTAFRATRDFLKDHLQFCSIEDVPFANHLAPMDNPGAFIQIVKKYLCDISSLPLKTIT